MPRSGRFTPGKRPGAHCTEGWVGPQRRSGRVLKISLPPGFDPRSAQRARSRYTDCATPAATLRKVRGSKPCGFKLFFSHSEHFTGPTLAGPHVLLYNKQQGYIPGGTAAGEWRWPPSLHVAPRLIMGTAILVPPLCIPSSMWGVTFTFTTLSSTHIEVFDECCNFRGTPCRVIQGQ